jgi:hypothetical protein
VNHSRKQNTDNYQQRVARQQTKGDEVLRRIKAKIVSFEDIVERNKAVEQWLATSRDDLSRIYEDGAVVEPLKISTDLNLDDLSHQRIVESLEAIVSERMAALDEIIQHTRAHDRKG